MRQLNTVDCQYEDNAIHREEALSDLEQSDCIGRTLPIKFIDDHD